MTREAYKDHLTGHIPEVCFVETDIPNHKKLKELDPYETGNVLLCRNHALMDERNDAVDKAIHKMING